MNLEAKVAEAIRSSLPEQTAGELKAYIEELEGRAAAADRLREQYEGICAGYEEAIKDRDAAKSELDEIRGEQKSIERDRAKLKASFIALEERERNRDLEIAEIKRDEAEKRADIAVSLVEKVFANNRYKHRVPVARSIAMSAPVVDNQGYVVSQPYPSEGTVEQHESESEG